MPAVAGCRDCHRLPGVCRRLHLGRTTGPVSLQPDVRVRRDKSGQASHPPCGRNSNAPPVSLRVVPISPTDHLNRTTPPSLAGLAPRTKQLRLAKDLLPFEIRRLSSVPKPTRLCFASWLTFGPHFCSQTGLVSMPPPAPSLDRRDLVPVEPAFADVGAQ
jgi:hypothetical protein